MTQSHHFVGSFILSWQKYPLQKKCQTQWQLESWDFMFLLQGMMLSKRKNSRKWESLHWPHQEEVKEKLNLLIEEIFQTILYPWRALSFFFESCHFVNMKYLEFLSYYCNQLGEAFVTGVLGLEGLVSLWGLL